MKIMTLRHLIREQLNALFEGGHAGSIFYAQAPALFELLDSYSTSRATRRPTIEKMEEFLNDLILITSSRDYEKVLSAYSLASGRTSPLRRAGVILRSGHNVNPEITMQFGRSVDLFEIERQFFKELGADFNVPNNPASGFENFFGAGLDWQSYRRNAYMKTAKDKINSGYDDNF